MKFQIFRHAAVLAAVLLAACGSLRPAAAQSYQNIVNQHFRTVSNGPQSAMIVDVADPNDADAVRKAAIQQFRAELSSPALQQELAYLRRTHRIKPGQQLDIAEVAIVRHNGRLALPTPKRTRDLGNNTLTFNFPTTGTGAWTNAQELAELQGLTALLYPQLKAVIGPPLWSGTVTVKNLDPFLGTVNEILGALLIINNGNVEIDFPTFSDPQTRFLAMCQVMAQAFRGPLRSAYHAWELGMARAATVAVAQTVQTYNSPTQGAVTLDPANGFYYTPYYDQLNQPPLANNIFNPPTKGAEQGPSQNPTQFGGMMVPRLQMSSTAWLKCYIENRSFFINFNKGYYNAFNANGNVTNDVNQLRAIAAAAQPTVEGQPFATWFEQQYVLDTSVTVGPKLYAYVQPTFPTAAGSNDGGAAFFLVYYNTTATGDEIDLSGTSNIIYWDYNFQNRLTFPSFDTVTIVNGFGTVSPFFVNLGGNPADQMRLAIDFPVNKEYVRVYFPANETGQMTAPNGFSGIIVGNDNMTAVDSGNLTVSFDPSTSVKTTVTQGEFGAMTPSNTSINGFKQVKLTFAPTGGTPLTFQRDVYVRSANAKTSLSEVAPIFQLVVPAQLVTLTPPNTYQAGIQMISLPILPFSGDMASVLGIDPKTALLAQYRQDSQGTDKYLRYPSLPRYLPGYGLWADFQSNVKPSVTGQPTDVHKDVSVALQFGWNQIGPPYSDANIDVTSDLFVTSSAGDSMSLAQAVSGGLVAAGIMAYSQLTQGYVDITSSNIPDVNIRQNLLVPWTGYWINILATEGVTLTYSPSTHRSVASKGRAATPRQSTSGWRVPLLLRDSNGHVGSIELGQAPQGDDTFVSSLDVASPPPFPGTSPLSLRFVHTDWSLGGRSVGTEFLSDIRRAATKSTWNMVAHLSGEAGQYTLVWQNTARLPRGTRLLLTDATSGAKQVLNNNSAYTFQTTKGETARSFTIVAEPRTPASLFIRNLTAQAPLPVRGRAISHVTISFELSTGAQTSVEIQLGGRVVRHLSTSGRAAESGVNELVWDLKDDQGRAMPSGAYLLQVTASTPEGEKTRSIAPLLITR